MTDLATLQQRYPTLSTKKLQRLVRLFERYPGDPQAVHRQAEEWVRQNQQKAKQKAIRKSLRREEREDSEGERYIQDMLDRC